MSYERELEVALKAAMRAGEQALSYFAEGLKPESKLDLTPVTVADREGERMITRVFDEAFPSDGILGEEGARKESSSGRRWIIDPVDGTRDFIRGIPTWAVLIGLEEGSDVVAGVCHFPAQNTTYYAARGMGAYHDGARIKISGITEPSQAVLCVNDFGHALQFEFSGRLLEWMKSFWAVRSFGGCQDAMYLAAGQAEAWIEAAGHAWDFAALKIVAEEAGAVFFNFDGHSTIYGGNGVLCVPALEVELRRFVIGAAKKPIPQAPPPIA